MGKLNEAQNKWLKELGALCGGGGALVALLADAPADGDRGPIAQAMAGLGAAKADAAPRASEATNSGRSTVRVFVPELEVAGGTRRELAMGGNLTLELKVRNWAKRPKGTALDWSATGGDKAVDFDFVRLDGEGALTVKGMNAGKGVVKVEVKVVGAGSHRFPDLHFTVHPTAKSAQTFVPRLDAPRTVNHELAIGDKVDLRLRVSNWVERPKGTVLTWGAGATGKAVDIDELQHRDGDGTIKVTGLAVGTGVVKTNVKVEGGGTYSFWDTEFKVINDPDPNRSVDQGGVADYTNLEQDMRNVVQDWRAAAHAGVVQFVTNELSKRIDKLESGNAGGFLMALLGNVVWAAAAFTTGGAAFGISIVGIAIGAVPAVPEKSKSFIPEVSDLMENYFDKIFDQMNGSLRTKAKALVDKYPGITRFHALGEFVAASYKASYFKLNNRHTTIPTLDQSALRDLYQQTAALKLDEAIKADEAAKKAIEDKKAYEKMIRDSRRRPGEV